MISCTIVQTLETTLHPIKTTIRVCIQATITVVTTSQNTFYDDISDEFHYLQVQNTNKYIFMCTVYLIQNSQAVKKVCGPQKGYGEKRCEIQGGGQEMAVMVG